MDKHKALITIEIHRSILWMPEEVLREHLYEMIDRMISELKSKEPPLEITLKTEVLPWDDLPLQRSLYQPEVPGE